MVEIALLDPEASRPAANHPHFPSRSSNHPQDGVSADGDAIRIEFSTDRTVRLFDVTDPGVQQCMVPYRAEMKVA